MVESVSDSIYFLQHRPPPRAAFTLLELLVVIAVLALLLAVLTPFYGKALNLAREGACKSNLRNWGIGFLAYAADRRDGNRSGQARHAVDQYAVSRTASSM